MEEVSALSAMSSRSSCNCRAMPRRPIWIFTTEMESPPRLTPSPPRAFLMASRNASTRTTAKTRPTRPAPPSPTPAPPPTYTGVVGTTTMELVIAGPRRSHRRRTRRRSTSERRIGALEEERKLLPPMRPELMAAFALIGAAKVARMTARPSAGAASRAERGARHHGEGAPRRPRRM